MTQIEIFKQKFDKMINNIPASVDSGAGYVIDEVYKILDSLENKLPKGLEEAAIDYAEYARKQSKDYAISAIADYDHGCIDGFKAGAEWMAEHGETIDGEILTTSDYGWETIRIPEKLYPLGTKVTIQIRKK